MSAGNEFEKRRRAFNERTVEITWPDLTYTVRVGSAADNFMVDRVVNATIVDAYGAMTVIVPDGLYSGQRLLVNYVAEDAVCLDYVSVEPVTAEHTASYELGEIGDYCTLEWIDSDTGWIQWNSLET